MTTTTRRHDLPPKWDGRRVDWSPWHDTTPGSLAYHCPSDTFACTSCGWIPNTQRRSIGRIHPEPGETYLVDGTRMTAWPIAQLAALRCTGCGLDQVTDMETGEVWDLDPSDYTTEGSVNPDDHPGTLF